MSTVIFSQSNAAGLALLAAYIRLWTETKQVTDLYVVCDPIYTLTDAFWRKTVPWLLGRNEAPPPVHHVVHDNGVYRFEPSTLPESATVVLLRLPRDKGNLHDCEQGLASLVRRFGALNVIEIVDETLPIHAALEGLRTCRLSDPPLLSLQGRPSEKVIELAGVAAAALYTPQPYAFPHMRAAHSVVARMRENQVSTLLELLNHGASSFDDAFPLDLAAVDYLEEDGAILLPVRLSEEQAARLVDPPASYLEHLLQLVLAERHDVRWGIAYCALEGHHAADFKTVIAARYHPDAMRQTLDERLKAHPSAAAWQFTSRKRPYYVMSKTDGRELRRMMTAILPAFFPRLDAALRAHGLARRERELVKTALAALEPEVTPAERPGSDLALTGSHPWTVGGELSADHPAILAAACLLGPTAKEEQLRELYERRGHLRLCRLWHNLKNEPRDRSDALDWRKARSGEVDKFQTAFHSLWDQVRMPLPHDQFSYAGQERDWRDLATLREACASKRADDAFFDAVKRLYEGPQGRGLGDEFFFSLTEMLNWFVRSTPVPPNWNVGGFWDPAEGAAQDCVMWWPEVVENVLRPFWDNVGKHAGGQGFLRVNVREAGRWLEMGILSSGQGVASDLLRERLRTRKGLATAAETMASYGGQVLFRCRDGWFQAGSPCHDLAPCAPSPSRYVRVALVDVPALERVVAANPALLHVAADDRPDVVFSAAPASSNPGWEAPCMVVSGEPGQTEAGARDFLETLVGFEVVFRFRRVGERGDAHQQPRRALRPLGNTCLLVNDDRAQLARWVEELPRFRVVTAIDADEAWARWSADKNDIGLVITDNYMPEENQGVELARRLREDGYRGPLVIATRAPSVVPEEAREALCLTVTGSGGALRGDRLRAWLQQVPS